MRNEVTRVSVQMPIFRSTQKLFLYTDFLNETILIANVIKHSIREVCIQRIENLHETVVACSQILHKGLREGERR
jgi:hypothetical protein